MQHKIELDSEVTLTINLTLSIINYIYYLV
jgi:hypothetical protein